MAFRRDWRDLLQVVGLDMNHAAFHPRVQAVAFSACTCRRRRLHFYCSGVPTKLSAGNTIGAPTFGPSNRAGPKTEGQKGSVNRDPFIFSTFATEDTA
jgi:hypothetical protein